MQWSRNSTQHLFEQVAFLELWMKYAEVFTSHLFQSILRRSAVA